MTVFLAGALTEFLIYISTRLIAETPPRRIYLLSVTAAEYLCWGLVIRAISIDGWSAVVIYAVGGLVGMLGATYLPKRRRGEEK